MSPSRRIVIIGAGFAGLAALKGLAGRGFELILIDPHRDFFEPSRLLAMIRTGRLDDHATTLLTTFAHQANATAIQATVEHVDVPGKTLTYIRADRERASTSFDQLVVAIGAHTAAFGVEGAETKTFHAGSRADVERILMRVRSLAREAAAAPKQAEEALQISAVGGGPDAVEALSAVVFRLQTLLAKTPGPVPRVTARLIVPGTGLLPGFRPRFVRLVRRELSRQGIEVIEGERVAHVYADRLRFHSGREVPSFLTLWMPRLIPDALRADPPFPTDHDGWITVDAALRVTPDVYAAGDIVQFEHVSEQADKNPIQSAAMGRSVARSIIAVADQKAPELFDPVRFRFLFARSLVIARTRCVDVALWPLRVPDYWT